MRTTNTDRQQFNDLMADVLMAVVVTAYAIGVLLIIEFHNVDKLV